MKRLIFIASLLIGLAIALAPLETARVNAQSFPGQPTSGAIYLGQGTALPAWVTSPTLPGNWTFAPTSNTAITINTSPNTVSKALNVTQSAGTSTVAGPVALNLFTTSIGLTITGTGKDSFGLFNGDDAAFRLNQTVLSTASATNAHLGGVFAINNQGSPNDTVGLVGAGYTNSTMSNGYLEGVNGHVLVGAAGAATILTGVDAEAGIETGGSAGYRMGIHIGSVGPVQATTGDGALWFLASTGNIAWNKIFVFSNVNGAAPVNSSTDMFYSDTPYTIANVFNLPNFTVSGNILNFPNAILSGAGQLALGAALPGATTIRLRVSNTSSGFVDLYAQPNSTTAFNGVDINNSAGTGFNELTIGGWDSSNTGTTVFGLARANRTAVFTSGSANLGMLLGTTNNTALTIGTNNTQRMTLTGAGGTGIGTDTNPQSTLTVSSNATSGTTSPGDLIALVGANGVQPVAAFYSYNNGVASNGIFAFRNANGTAASPTATATSDVIGGFVFGGYNAVAAAFANSKARVVGVSLDNFDNTHQGMALEFDTTPAASTTRAQAMRVMAGVVIGTGTTDPGTGIINAQGGFQANGTAGVSTTCTVTAGNSYVFTFGLLTSKGANCT